MRRCRLLVFVVQAGPVHALALQIGHAVPTLTTAEGREVEVVKAAHEHFQATAVAGVAVIDLRAIAQKYADAGLFALHVIIQAKAL